MTIAAMVSGAGCQGPERIAGVILVGDSTRRVVAGHAGSVQVLVPPRLGEHASLDSMQLPDGLHDVELTSIDRDGNMRTVSRTYEVANGSHDPPPFAGSFVEVLSSSPVASTAPVGIPRHGGVSADFDGDGDVDVFAWDLQGGHMLQQEGPWNFRETRQFAHEVSCAGIADLDRDGDPDLVTGGSEVHVFENRGGELIDRADLVLAAGLAIAPNQGYYDAITFTDLDADGLTDIAIAGFSCDGSRNYVLRNEGGLSFRDVAPAMGLDFVGASTIAFAIDRPAPDGVLHVWPMFETCGPSLPMTDAHLEFGGGDDLPVRLRGSTPATRAAYMGSAYIDADEDGALDLWMALTSANPLYLAPTFSDSAARRYGLEALPDDLGNNIEQWAMLTFDADLDGHADVLVVQAATYGARPDIRPFPRLMWRSPNGAFHQVSAAAGLAQPFEGCHAVSGSDLDGDGDTDLILGCSSRFRILRNELTPAGQGHTINLRGSVSNPDGIDAQLSGAGSEHRLSRGGGQPYAGGVVRDSMALTEGSLLVTWPSGISQTVPASSQAVIAVREPEVISVEPRWIAAGGSARVEIVVRPELFGGADASVRVEANSTAWDPNALVRNADGAWRGSFVPPAGPTTVTFTVQIGTTQLRVRPKVFVR